MDFRPKVDHSNSVSTGDSSQTKGKTEDSNYVVTNNVSLDAEQNRTYFQTANVKVYGKKGNVDITLVFDDGFDHTYVTKEWVD